MNFIVVLPFPGNESTKSPGKIRGKFGAKILPEKNSGGPPSKNSGTFRSAPCRLDLTDVSDAWKASQTEQT